MKGNKKLFTLLVLLGTLSWLTAAHNMANMHKDKKHGGGNDDPVTMGMGADEYWDRVKGDKFEFTGKERVYYISSDEVHWDYAPDGINIVFATEFQGIAQPFVEVGPQRIGTTYKKCLYREYTDETFTKLKPRSKDDLHLGFLGPFIYAEVGDIIKVNYRNKCRFPTSMHPHHLFYDKSNEGAVYNDTTTAQQKEDNMVPSGETHCYTWEVPERCGPGPMEGSSIMSVYYSHVDLNADLYAGLAGPISIARKGMAKKNGMPKDLNRLIFQLYLVSDESSSPYLTDSFNRFSLSPPGTALPTGGAFGTANQKFSINGWIFGNGHIPFMYQYEQVRWCTQSLGNRDAHTPHMHGNTYLVNGMRMDVTSIMPGEIVCLDMKPDDVGYWLTHCHVGDHLDDGMVTRFLVLPEEDKDDKKNDKKDNRKKEDKKAKHVKHY